MTNLLLVFIGGALGSVFRYLSFMVTDSFFVNRVFLVTMMINIVGSFLIGMLYIMTSEQIRIISEPTRLLLATGFLGGFTTFSAFLSIFLN
jgi:CrcB protein